jgi:hypothetical protein
VTDLYRTDTGHELPGIVTPDGRVRLLASLPPTGRITSAPRFEAAEDVIPRSEWPRYLPVSRRRPGVPIRDQLQIGSCACNAASSALMMDRDAQGFTFDLLSATYLYSLVNGGVDAGSYPEDVIRALVARGTCLESQAPEGLYLRSQIRDRPGADATAGRFKVGADDWYAITTWEGLVTATLLGYHWFAPVYATQPWYQVGPDGRAPATPGPGNHEVCGGEGATIDSRGDVVLDARNSWGERWGAAGYFGYREAHMVSQPYWRAIAVKSALPDPQDPRCA